MEDPNGNDVHGHLDRLLRLAENPDAPPIRNRNVRGVFRFVRRDCQATWLTNGTETRALLPANVTEWYVEGEPRPTAAYEGALGFQSIYARLIGPSSGIAEVNFQATDSAVCLAGRGRGRSATEAAYGDLEFCVSGDSASLAQLLTIHGWHRGLVSRVRFFNTRTGEFDRAAGCPELVVADGPSAFAAIRSREDCGAASIVVVVARTSDRVHLDEFRESIDALLQYYEPGPLPGGLTLPSGVSARMLVRR